MSQHTKNALSTHACEAWADTMSKAKDGSTVLLATQKSTALLQLLWTRVLLYVDSLFSMPDVPASNAALFIMSCESSPNLFSGGGSVVGCRSVGVQTTDKLKCGPVPNVMAALPNTGDALCSTTQSFADAHYYSVVQ